MARTKPCVTPDSCLLGCRNAAFAYDGVTAVRGLNFTVRRGDYLCVVGENGSGKSTLVKGLLRLKTPQSGSVLCAPGGVGYLPQQTAAQKDFPASVQEVVLSGRARGGLPFYTRKDRTAAQEAMQRLELEELRRRCYRELSGGQQQRTLLARALCAGQTALLLDEPAAGLDPLITRELYRLIAQLNQTLGLTIVMVSHDIPGAVRYASHILHLNREQVFFGPTREYLQTDAGKAFAGGGAHA